MPDWFLWFTRFENTKVVALLLFFTTFCAILIYLYT
ncbi:MAG TPA: CcoQ/FixQ family Cbb3-type cytochrome c oxidase assembly chaperone, partial [Gammaproteobacteria bacterium]|nr:CcoQ/FixQ family Cbb3-type cytochrome c oxidase assembly chaperone [Gammaproteobacteria bacterium]